MNYPGVKIIMKRLLAGVMALISSLATWSQSIDSSYPIKIGGINQWVNVKGKNVKKPLLLWLHGGPGGSAMNNGDRFTRKLQDSFVVVQWDQRETGKTLSLNKSNRPLTFRLFEEDTHDIIDSLLTQFHQQKIYLVGYSWGTALGFYIADIYQDAKTLSKEHLMDSGYTAAEYLVNSKTDYDVEIIGPVRPDPS